MTPALRGYLSARGAPVTYAQAMHDLSLPSMKALTQALETLMDEDAAAGRPFLAAMVISRTGPLPAWGFFEHAGALGREVGDHAAFHARELLALGKTQGLT